MDTGTLNNIIGIIGGCVGLIWGLCAFIEHRLVAPRDARFADAIENQSTYKRYHYFVKELLLEPLTRFVGDRDTKQCWSARLFDRVLLLAWRVRGPLQPQWIAVSTMVGES